MEVLESHKGADTIPVEKTIIQSHSHSVVELTILYQDSETALHEETGIKHNQSKTQWQHIITSANFEKIPNTLLEIER